MLGLGGIASLMGTYYHQIRSVPVGGDGRRKRRKKKGVEEGEGGRKERRRGWKKGKKEEEKERKIVFLFDTSRNRRGVQGQPGMFPGV